MNRGLRHGCRGPGLPSGGEMRKHMALASTVCLLLAGLSVTGNAQIVSVESCTTVVCIDSTFWVDVRVDSAVDSIHSYACLIYVDTSRVWLDSVSRGAILDSVAQHHSVWFGWEYDDHYPDSLYFGASIFDAGIFVDGPGQLGRMWLRTKLEGQTPVAFAWCIIRDPFNPSGPGMEVVLRDGQIAVLPTGYGSGDANSSGSVDPGDVVFIINYLFREGPEPEPSLLVGDVNCDSIVNGSDVVYLLNYLFRNEEPPCDPCHER
jgi:hypothetical protein